MKYLSSCTLPSLFLLLFPAFVFAQNLKPVAAHVRQLQLEGKSFEPQTVFSERHRKPKDDDSDLERNARFLKLETGGLNQLLSRRPEYITLDLPWKDSVLRLSLYQARILSDNFSVLTSDGTPDPYAPGVYYRGIIEGEPGSLAAVSFFDGEVIGVLAHPLWGNLNLGRLERSGNTEEYVLFRESDLPERPNFECQERFPPKPPKPIVSHQEVSGCVQIFFECDYELFTNKGSVSNTVNYVTGFFNVVATLFTNETISVAISQIYVWTTPDGYPTNSSGDVLDAFQAFRVNFTGHLAHLVGLGGGGLGGIAYLDVICQTGWNYAYSNISSSYNSFPTYSWTVEVVTHETGHNLSSNHTHWCGWPGGAIDNCYTPEGTCNPGPPPSNGGTIMSYCHLTANGINFNNGFGPLPGNAIRDGVTAAAGCIPTSCPSNSCSAPTALTTSNVTSTSVSIGWNAVGGATSYKLQYRLAGSSAWTTINNATNPQSITGLSPATEYEAQVQAVCGGISSPFFVGILFKTANSACAEPGNLTHSNATNTTVQVNWTENGTATQWQIQYGPQGFTLGSGTILTATVKPYTITGLAPSTFYEFYVRATCGGALGNSNWVGPHTFNTLLGNDNPAGAIQLTVDAPCPGTNIYFNTGAGTFSGEFSPSTANGGYWNTGANNTVWFRFTAPASGSVFITTDIAPLGTLDDLQIALYNNNNPTSINHLLVSNEDGGTQGQGYATQVYYSGLTPGTEYFIQVDGWNTNVGTFCIAVYETFAIPNPTSGVCTTFPTQTNVDGAAAPTKWFNIYSKPNGGDIGLPIVAIKSSFNLGNVTVRENRYGSVQTAPNGVKYMQRYYNLNCTQNQSMPKLVRLFYTNAELDALKTATGQSGNTAEDLNISHFDGVVEDCTPNNNTANGTTLLTLVTATGIGSSDIFYEEFISPGFSEMAAIFGQTSLPVELLRFFGNVEPVLNHLGWSTALEKDLESFTLERSPDGTSHWREIGRLVPQAGDQYPKTYVMDDPAPISPAYYRLKMKDLDESTRYSDIVLLERQVPDGLLGLYPNPALDMLFAEYQASTETTAVFRILGADGGVLRTQAIELESGLNLLPFPISDLPAGLYFFEIAGQKGKTFLKK